GAVVEADARRRDVAANLRALANAYALGAEQIALHIALDEYRMREDVRADLALRADGQRVALQLNGAVDLALDDQVFLAAQIAVDMNRRADHGGFARRRSGAFGGLGLRHALLRRLRIAS